MSKRVKTNGVTQAPGPRSAVRATERNSLRKRRQETSAPTPVLANSVHSLVLGAKPGSEILFARGGFCSDYCDDLLGIPDPAKMYQDLLACTRAAYKVNGLPAIKDPLKSLPIHLALNTVIERFLAIVPSEWGVNIDKGDKGDFHFVLYQPADFGWGFVGVGLGTGVIKKLEKNAPELGELFLNVIGLLIKHVNIAPWWSVFDWPIDWLEDMLQQGDDAFDEETQVIVRQDIEVYKSGPAKELQKQFGWKFPFLSADHILERLQGHRKNHPIVKLIRAGCELIKEELSWCDYEYCPNDNEDQFGLRLGHQMAIVWDWGDSVMREFEELMDAESQDGTQDPVANVKITKRTNKSDWDRLPQILSFPLRLQDYLQEAQQLINKYESKNTSNNG